MKKILIVDDEEELRTALVNLLEFEGYKTLEADNGLSALEMVRKIRPDLIISDVSMPNMNGFILSEIIKEDPTLSGIPLILMSGVAQNAGAWNTDPQHEYLEKPFAGVDILSIVRNNLNQQLLATTCN